MRIAGTGAVSQEEFQGVQLATQRGDGTANGMMRYLMGETEEFV